jgi:hypothetical protein
MEIIVREDGTASLIFDLDGSVFGMFDPDPIIFDFGYDANGAIFEASEDSVFGDLVFVITADGWSLESESEIVFTAEGTFAPDLIQATYTVGAPDDSWSADGTFVLQRP